MYSRELRLAEKRGISITGLGLIIQSCTQKQRLPAYLKIYAVSTASRWMTNQVSSSTRETLVTVPELITGVKDLLLPYPDKEEIPRNQIQLLLIGGKRFLQNTYPRQVTRFRKTAGNIAKGSVAFS